MSAGNVVNIGTRVDLGPLQSDMQKAAQAVQTASENMAKAQLNVRQASMAAAAAVKEFTDGATKGSQQASDAMLASQIALNEAKGATALWRQELKAADAALIGLINTEEEETTVLRSNISTRMAATAELRVLEGSMMGSTRAAGALLSTLPGLSEAMQVAFPIFGAFALVSILTQAASKVYDLKKAFDALDGAEIKAGFDAILAGEKILKVKPEKFSADAFARMIEGAPANKDIEIANAGTALKQIQQQRELHDAQAQVAEQGLTGVKLQQQKIADIQKEIEFTRQAKVQADALAAAYVKQAEAQTKTVTIVTGHSGVVRSTDSHANITDPKQIEELQQQTRLASQAAEQYAHDLDMLQVKLQGVQAKESHSGDKSAAQAAKTEADAQYQIMLQNGQRNLAFQQKLTDELTETWLRQVRVEEEVARKQEEFSKEATRQFIEDQHQKIEAAKEAAEQQMRTAEDQYRGTEQSTSGQVSEGAINPAQRIAILQQALKQEYAVKQAAIAAQEALDAGNVAAYQQDLNKMTQLDQQYAQQQAQLALQATQALSQPYINAFNQINNSWLQLQNKLIFGTHNISRQFANMGVEMLQGFAAATERMLVKALEADLRMLMSKQTTTAAQTAITAAGAAQATAIKQAEGLKQAIIDAKNAAVAGWKAGMNLPFPLDLFMAPTLAAAGFAGAIAQFETGGIIPNTGVALVHSGEAVLPRNLTNLLMNTANDNRSSSSSSANMSLNFHGMSDSAFRQMSSRHAGHLVKVVQRGLRDKGRM